MDYPFGHHRHGHHERSREEEEEKQRYPPPQYRPPGYPFQQGESAYTETPEYNRPPHHHHSHEGFNEQEYGRPAPPPPPPSYGYGGYSDFPPEPQNYPRPPPRSEPEPIYSSVQHVGHESGAGFEPEPTGFGREGPHRPHGAFSFFHHHSKGSEASEVVKKPTVRVFSKAETNFSLSVLNGKVILARSDPNDESQAWILVLFHLGF